MPTQRLLLELEVGSDPIVGRLEPEGGGAERIFSGWIELAAALAAVIEAREPRPDEGRTPNLPRLARKP